jgi:hypothetical protein
LIGILIAVKRAMPVKLAVTIDVEEEGLFLGQYSRTNAPVENVKELKVLDPVFREWDIRPTLLLTYQVARNRGGHDLLHELRDRWKGEIGAHLHHWNTPPIKELPYRDPVPSEFMTQELLAAKLDSLIEAINQAGFIPESFRMGRFNLGPKTFSVIRDYGIKVDSSVCPLHRFYGGPDHLGAPTDPYYPDTGNLLTPGASQVLEAPVTIAPFVNGIGRYFQFLCDYKIVPCDWVAWFSQNVACLPAQPMWTGIKRMQTAADIHIAHGGQVVTIFFHSSELMPGGCPKHRTKEDITRFLKKLDSFFLWLYKTVNVHSVTLSELGRIYAELRNAGAANVPGASSHAGLCRSEGRLRG